MCCRSLLLLLLVAAGCAGCECGGSFCLTESYLVNRSLMSPFWGLKGSEQLKQNWCSWGDFPALGAAPAVCGLLTETCSFGFNKVQTFCKKSNLEYVVQTNPKRPQPSFSFMETIVLLCWSHRQTDRQSWPPLIPELQSQQTGTLPYSFLLSLEIKHLKHRVPQWGVVILLNGAAKSRMLTENSLLSSVVRIVEKMKGDTLSRSMFYIPVKNSRIINSSAAWLSRSVCFDWKRVQSSTISCTVTHWPTNQHSNTQLPMMLCSCTHTSTQSWRFVKCVCSSAAWLLSCLSVLWWTLPKLILS